jgi:peptidoglycan-associated lipoprotein
MKRLLLSLAVATLIAGCSSPDVKEQPGAAVEERKPDVTTAVKPAPPPQSSTAPAQTVTPSTVKPAEAKPSAANPLKDPNDILSKRSVYYDYDSSVVKDEFKPLVTAHARYLAQNREARVVIQGNTDERGSREYNIALGQRRADSVKQMMLLLGAQETQIESVSFGEEKPRALGKDEESYAQNRRSDLVYQGE